LTANQRIILSEIDKNVYTTANELSLLVGISQRKIEKNLSVLKNKGLIKRIGPDKGGHWEIAKPRETRKGGKS
jgi:ATP-dependent DNA helicase RecG